VTDVKSISAKQDELANLLVQARRDVRQFSLPPELLPATAREAYAINEAVADRLGWEPLGWKIAGTTDAVRGKLNLDGPIYGRTFRRFACMSPAHFKAADLLDPLIECEFFVTTCRRGQNPGRSRKPPRRSPRFMRASRWRNAAIRERRCRRCRASSPTAARRGVTSSAIASSVGATGWAPHPVSIGFSASRCSTM
jgi:hypothetical protein